MRPPILAKLRKRRRPQNEATITILPSFFQGLEEDGNETGPFRKQPVFDFEAWQVSCKELFPCVLTHQSRTARRFCAFHGASATHPRDSTGRSIQKSYGMVCLFCCNVTVFPGLGFRGSPGDILHEPPPVQEKKTLKLPKRFVPLWKDFDALRSDKKCLGAKCQNCCKIVRLWAFVPCQLYITSIRPKYFA